MKNLLVFLLVMISISAAFAQENYIFSKITTMDGLSENRVRSISQLADGRMVIVTEGLVNLYDGTSFNYLHHNDEDAYYLSHYYGFHRTYIDSENFLWIKDYKKLMLFDINKESFVSDPDNFFLNQGIKQAVIDCFMDSKKNFWYLTQDDQLMYRDASRGDKAIIFISGFSKITGEEDNLYDLTVYENQLFLFFKSGNIICYDVRTQQEIYQKYSLSKDLAEAYGRTSLVVQSGRFFYQIRNGTSGILLRYDIDLREWETILQQDYLFNTISVDGKGDLWISCEKGLWHIESDHQKKHYIPEIHTLDGSILKVGINTQYNDNQGGFWIGTYNDGLLYYHPERFKFKKKGRTFFNKTPEREFRVNGFVKWNEELLVGTNNGIFRYSPSDSVLTLHPDFPENIPYNRMKKDQKGRIWICTHQNGLYRLDNHAVKHYAFPYDKFGFSVIFHIHESPSGDLYLCTDNGFGLFNPETGEYRPATIPKEKRINNVFQLIDYEENSLMGFCNIGLFTYDIQKDSLYAPGRNQKEKPAMFCQPNHNYNCLYKDSRGMIWFGTQDGLNVWNPDENALKSFYTENGIVNNSIQSISEDKQTRIWVSTSYGISRIDIEEVNNTRHYSFVNYDHYDGVTEKEFIERSVYVSEDETFFWGGMDSFNEINMNRIDRKRDNTLIPLFVKLFLFGSEVKLGEKYNGNIILDQSISSTKELRLKYNQNFLTLEFTALNYINPTQTFYRYKLEGIDESWHEISADKGMGSANYTNLPPGTYNLKVFATNNKEWNNEYIRMKIIISPPFWKTTFAYILYISLFLLLLYVVASYYLRVNKNKIIVRQKEELDNLKFRFFTNMGHELRTPLTLILTPLDVLLKKVEDESVRNSLSGIYRNANHLLNIVNQLLDFRKIEMGGETLRLTCCNVNEFIESVCSSFEPASFDKQIKLYRESHVKNLNVYIDKDKMQKVIYNLLSNACKFTPKAGSVTLVMDKMYLDKEQQEFLLLQVIDTGCGIPESDFDKIFNRYYQVGGPNDVNTGSGIGLHLVREYIKLHKGFIHLESQLNVGSVFSVYIPLNLGKEMKEEPVISGNESMNKSRLLIVEDNDEFSAFLYDQLSPHYQVEIASDGKEGLEKAKQTLPDLIITDVMMPVMNGIELSKQLKNDIQTSHISIILLTARSSEEAQIEGYKSGADAYISKPFSIDILLLRIHHLLEQQNKRKELFKKAIVVLPESLTSTSMDEKLIKNAIACVERNLDNPLYSVEQMSKDMNMDRTGLYRKLIAIVGQTPSLFIRSIRLKKAAQLLKGGYPVSEVADLVGFGTVSYFGKCFQEEFGIKPSQYKRDENV